MKSKRACMIRRFLPVLPVLILVGLLSSCSLDRWAKVEPGEYRILAIQGSSDNVINHDIAEITVDREAQHLILNLKDGTQNTIKFTTREKADWPSGCPANINSTRMEVLDLELDRLSVGGFEFTKPILVRECPPDPEIIVLRSDGEIGGSGSACYDQIECVFFSRQDDNNAISIPDPDQQMYEDCLAQGGRWEDLSNSEPGCVLPTNTGSSLPVSEKGYELYSWYDGGEGVWNYTLITGTNRLKTYEEIVEAPNAESEDGWVKISVKGVESLKDVLGRLPRGSDVFLISPRWLQNAGVGEDLSDAVAVPEGVELEQLKIYCQELGLELHLFE